MTVSIFRSSMSSRLVAARCWARDWLWTTATRRHRSPEPALAGAGVARVPSPLYSQGRYAETRDQHLAVLHYDQHWIEREGTKSSLYYRDIMGFRAFKLSSTVLVSIHNAF